jgi:hypothetical protein
MARVAEVPTDAVQVGVEALVPANGVPFAVSVVTA